MIVINRWKNSGCTYLIKYQKVVIDPIVQILQLFHMDKILQYVVLVYCEY